VRPYLQKKKSQKWAAGVAQGGVPEFKPQYRKKKEPSHTLSGNVNEYNHFGKQYRGCLKK
jgi:hypothetical protein